MPWKEKNTMDLKEEFVIRAANGKQSFTSLCREYTISRKTGYKWINRYSEQGFAGLEDVSRRPKQSPEKLSEECICTLVRLKLAHLRWGPKKIHDLYLGLSKNSVSLSSVKRVLKKSGLVKKRRRRAQTPPERITTRHEVKEPNDLWTVDFKGTWYSADRQRCEPLTVRDEYSKYILAAQSLPASSTEHVKACFKRLFRQYGLPKVIRSDNGSPFASSNGLRGLSKLSCWWVSLGIELERIDPGCPSQNGSHERMHRDLKQDIQKQITGNLSYIQKSLDLWRKEFNTVRPHEALGMRKPEEVYRKSPRTYYEPEPLIEYLFPTEARKVSSAGCIKFHNKPVFLSSALAGLTVGMKEVDEELISVCFNYLELGFFEKQTYNFIPLSGKDIGKKTVMRAT